MGYTITHGIYFVHDYSLGLSYDSKGLLDSAEFHYSDSNFRNTSLFWESVDLFTLNSKQLIALLKEKDPNLESYDQIELVAFVSQKYGIAFGIYYDFEEYGDYTKELNEYWSSIILFKKGKQI